MALPIGYDLAAVAPECLGYGVPLVVSVSSAFDDVRGWAVTATPETLAAELVRLATDAEAYTTTARRAWMGAQYRNLAILARGYRAAVVQAAA
jgi:hypothetical protein